MKKAEKYALKKKTRDSPVLWVCGFCGDSHWFSTFSVGVRWVWGLKSSPTARQPWL